MRSRREHALAVAGLLGVVVLEVVAFGAEPDRIEVIRLCVVDGRAVVWGVVLKHEQWGVAVVTAGAAQALTCTPRTARSG